MKERVGENFFSNFAEDTHVFFFQIISSIERVICIIECKKK